MRALAVDFAGKRPIAVWIALAVTLGLIAVCGFEALAAVRADVELERARSKLGALHAEIADHQRSISAELAMEEVSKTKAVPYLADAQTIAALAAFNMSDGLTALESSQVEGVRVLLIEVLPAVQTIRVDIEFTVQSALTEYLGALNVTPEEFPWKLVSAQLPSATRPGAATFTKISTPYAPR